MTCCPTDTDRKPIKAVDSGGLAFLKVDTAKKISFVLRVVCVT